MLNTASRDVEDVDNEYLCVLAKSSINEFITGVLLDFEWGDGGDCDGSGAGHDGVEVSKRRFRERSFVLTPLKKMRR